MLLFMFWFNMVSLEEQLVPLNKVWQTGSSISGRGNTFISGRGNTFINQWPWQHFHQSVAVATLSEC
jgi:hypothetical protein